MNKIEQELKNTIKSLKNNLEIAIIGLTEISEIDKHGCVEEPAIYEVADDLLAKIYTLDQLKELV